ncbi:phosphoadenosine phosphosulfate reductase family protein [uncultured Selenomonas sp.]|uniref:phosphoadenosine phosphosulfate reductase domain-containing protein n=1 Tax=uncultured Selenomonas sp. TaxID=159275 RepID=UPI0025DFA7D2|nr:phosphoadenosine phosphosulfate reductase family protein [uncultured Selenomonas sp.]
MYGYEWTKEYGIYRLTIDAKIQKEIRPVFHEELDFFGMDAYWDYPKDTDAPLLWAEGVRRYVLNGKPVAEAQGGGFYTKPTIKRLTDERLKLQPVDVDRLYEVNRSLMTSLEQKAVSFIQEQHEKYRQKGFAFVCAFSGGKDSLVLLDLTAKALAPSDFYVVFSNTGMELSDTLKAVEKAKQHWPQLRFEEAKCHMDPEETWDEFGPPGRRMRWCCAVHKSVPTILKLRQLTHSYNAKAVVFDGVRAEESARRAKYGEVSIGAKNISQINASPIHKWNTAEVYCHLLHKGILFNNAYRLGLFRVGCMVCPMSSDWWDGIANHYYENEMRPLLNKVEQYAKKTKVKSEVTKYIEGGGWKARMGGRGLPNGGNRVKEQIKNDTITFTIEGMTQSWNDVSPLLGTIVEQDETTGVQKIGNINFSYNIQISDKCTIVSYMPFSLMDRFVISHLRGIAYKVAYCEGCKACMVQCPTGAFTIQENGKILIRESLCVHCSNCLTFSEKSCMIARSLSITGGSNSMNMKGMNPYQHFGLRQAWLEHYMNDGVKCFSMGVLGNRQYEGLKAWLKESGLLAIDKSKSLVPTELFEKMTPFGSYNPFTWAIVWANLCYNSVISRWYCLNAEVGATYEKGDLVVMIGESYSKSTRENAITALTETFRMSPIGASLKQGIPIELTRNTYSYLRDGWDYPDAVALLYALYLYAEHVGKKSFTFTELANAHNNPDARGISPHDIYGIDLKAFREQVQGLAISFPKHIRVSFVGNLDNIILENYSSNDIIDLAQED